MRKKFAHRFSSILIIDFIKFSIECLGGNYISTFNNIEHKKFIFLTRQIQKKSIAFMLTNEITLFLENYFDVLQNQDLNLFDKVFHKDCTLYSQQDGALIIRSFDSYREMVSQRNSPESEGFTRHEQILLTDFLSPTMATIKVRLKLFNNIMEDHLNIMKHDGTWMIYAKHFYKVGVA